MRGRILRKREEMVVGPQDHLDIIDKTFKKASNKAVKGILGAKKSRLRQFQGLLQASFAVIIVGCRGPTPYTALVVKK